MRQQVQDGCHGRRFTPPLMPIILIAAATISWFTIVGAFYHSDEDVAAREAGST
jgi:hypothetical protein